MPSARILIATPVRGASPETASVTLGYAESTRRLSKDPNIEVSVLGFGCDLTRTRSRVVADFREFNETNPDNPFTHVLWWDDDVIPRDVLVIRRMLETGHDCVAAPYPRKRVDWQRVATVVGGNPEARAYDYPVLIEDGAAQSARDATVLVSHIGMGFMLCSRGMLDTMWDHYASSLSFGDVIGQRLRHTVALFALVLPPQRPGPPSMGPLLSEDYSFCERWRALGGEVRMFVGEGSPLDHVGTHVFRGHREALTHGG
jgi:hypothetical protein